MGTRQPHQQFHDGQNDGDQDAGQDADEYHSKCAGGGDGDLSEPEASQRCPVGQADQGDGCEHDDAARAEIGTCAMTPGSSRGSGDDEHDDEHG